MGNSRKNFTLRGYTRSNGTKVHPLGTTRCSECSKEFPYADLSHTVRANGKIYYSKNCKECSARLDKILDDTDVEGAEAIPLQEAMDCYMRALDHPEEKDEALSFIPGLVRQVLSYQASVIRLLEFRNKKKVGSTDDILACIPEDSFRDRMRKQFAE